MITAVVLVGLVAYRIWRLIALDKITESPRYWLFNKRTIRGVVPRLVRVQQFVYCAWCFGFWITGAVTFAGYFFGYVEDWLVVWLASSVIVGFLGDRS